MAAERMQSYIGQHRVRYERNLYVTCRIDVSPLVTLTPEVDAILCADAQRRADDVAHREFYRTHVLDTPQGRLEDRVALCRIRGYTTERLPASASVAPSEERGQ